ncbi:winged helix DNA-binding domain-containing protein [Nocardia huaxiensis]|uniref:Winged helix DNA-binding domain-containing protein n=1 Tax=Nocardia huaxiensis TaxID=2755382 RepID=A0A7D6V8K0_9NOCA|nr:winged helix DNA-binding domain-containing protein [Nocardia huaxiensis]QLY30201.1 winged helix DNA-binding domain-containing protein [Nocardia huaxiensis]
MTELSVRTLNRTLLLRQHLTERVSMPAEDLIRHLVAVQGQEPNWPYVGLWTRLAGFRRDELQGLLEDRSVVRATMIRRTVHLAAAADFRWLHPTVQPFVGSVLGAAYFREAMTEVDPAELAAAGRELLTGRTVSRRELGRALGERFPTPHPGRLAQGLGALIPLVHDGRAGAWGGWRGRQVGVALAEEWIGEPVEDKPQPETMILRYLAAFGPASVADMQNWSGVTRLAEVVARLRPGLRIFRDDTGRELFDLPDAPIADANMPVPVRFLPAFDNVALGHQDRRRIISDEDRARITKIASAGVPMYLVDGFVHGRWDLDGTTIRITPWHPLSAAEETAVRAEAEQLLPVIVPGEDGKVIIEP